MSKTWKWILGIVLVLVVLAALVAAGYFWQTHFGYARVPFNGPRFNNPQFNGPLTQRGDDWGRIPFNNRSYRMMGGRGFMPFGGGFFFLGGLLRIALIGAVLYGAYWLGQRNARAALASTPVATPPPATPGPAAPSGSDSAAQG